MDVPPRPRMAQEPPLLARRSSPRHSAWLCGRSAIDRRAPADLPRRAAAASATAPAHCPAAPRRARPAPARMRRMRARHLPAPRQRDDPPAMPRRVERQHHVDHRQPGAEDQHVAAARPRTRSIAARASSLHGLLTNSAGSIPSPTRIGSGGWLPCASTSARAVDLAPVVERRRASRPVARRRDRARLRPPRPAARHRLVEDRAQIGAEPPPRRRTRPRSCPRAATKSSGRSGQALIFAAGTLSRCAASRVE